MPPFRPASGRVSELSSQAYERLSLEQALRRAIEQNLFSLHYQPQLLLENGRVIGAEALLRFEHPAQGMVPPDKFIPLAEETGLIIPIGEWVLEQACKQAAMWMQKFPDFCTMAINISGIQFQRGKLEKSIPRLLSARDIDASVIELEITENQLMSSVRQTTTLLNRLSAMGMTLAIDDFGTGYSSLSYLKRFPVDKLKIDKSFVRDMTDDPDDAAIARSIVALGHSMGLKIVAEGIEHPE